MQIFTKSEALSEHLSTIKATKKTIGFVPTMGALHDGHASLIEKSIKENDFTVVSIFVNPTQFNNTEDLDKYPRTLEKDVALISAIDADIIIFNPTVATIYDANLTTINYDFDGLESEMEGKHRPGHFDGVGTIVGKLFDIVAPANAYFGEKDFQQLQIIRKLISKFDYKVALVPCAIYREKNGLAMSSRNERLSSDAREKAKLIFETLTQVKNKFSTHSIANLNDYVQETFKKMPEFKLEYFEIADESSLKTSIRKNKSKKYRAFIAVFIENIRLIDNISLK